ncbi:MAG: NADH-quinone oxidoreductase subunit J [Actinobacteria bacterium]|nr:NADH-quinone oxidoreductase subunit J [Actinomycetota bacterium]
MVDKLFFIVFATLAVVGAIGVITRTNIVHALILLVLTFVNIAAIYMLTQAYFLAVIQVLVYAGAILVLFAFVVMFLNLREFREIEQLYAKQKWVVLVVAPLILAEFVVVTVGATYQSVKGGLTPATIASAGGNVNVLGTSLFKDMLLPFEVASLILLVGMIGAIVLAQKEDSPDMALREWPGEGESVRDLMEQEV